MRARRATVRAAIFATQALLGAVALAVPAAAGAQAFSFQRDCAQYLQKRGYSVDYIQLKTGKRQRGMADEWKGNVEVADVAAGDVVLTYIPDKGRLLHAAYVEEVRRDADGKLVHVMVTDWNLGRYTDERCFVTDRFGIATPPRPIAADRIVRVWRPSLPL